MLEVIDPFVAEIWSFMTFHRGFQIFDFDFRLMKPQASFLGGNVFSYVYQYCCQISCLLVQYYLPSAVHKTCFYENFLNFTLFWCTLLYSGWLKWLVMPHSDWLALIKEFLKKQVLNQTVLHGSIRVKCFLPWNFLFLVGFP